ncbi:DUF6221 family protein [Plantactinospora sp. WMMB782]|uniref:DUF6221 family protein n=1 Tax=Plantactinospora sp. WMMB782 TaxID=3404121 RepID=UPI003B959569
MSTVNPVEILAFVRAQLDEDERKVAAMEREAERARTAPIFQSYPPNWLAGVDIFVSPKRWQAEVDAKRRILAEHPTEGPSKYVPIQYCGTCQGGDGIPTGPAPCSTVRLLALPYADREGYREEWRPT